MDDRPGTYLCPHCSGRHPVGEDRCAGTGRPVRAGCRMEGRLLGGRYRVGEKIGGGGMGVVYEGIHEGLGRRTAIKVLRPTASAGGDAMETARREARLAASAGHPNIVDVLDMGATEEGIPYIVMEHLDGSPLGDVLRRMGRLGTADSIAVAMHVLDALDAVHQRGIVHGDLKPDNVFLAIDPAGACVAKILDFGLSQLGGHSGGRRGTGGPGRIAGTIGYMAPEQAIGGCALDHRADIFATGVVLYRMLTGRLPFDVSTRPEYVAALASSVPVPPGEIVPLPDGLQEIVMRAIAREAAERWGSASSFEAALAPVFDAIGGRPSRTEKVKLLEATIPFVRAQRETRGRS